MSKIKKGSVLVYSLIILSIMLLIAMAMSATSALDIKSSMATQKSTQAFQAADSAAESIFKEIKEGVADGTDVNIGDLDLGVCVDGKLTLSLTRGEAEVSFFEKTTIDPFDDCNTPISSIGRIKSVGTFGGTVRAVEMSINNL